MAFRAIFAAILGICLGGSVFAAAPAEATQVHSFPSDPVRGQHCLGYVFEDVMRDERTDAVQNFLAKHNCQIVEFAPEFVLAADLNKLDYRLLPALSVLETGCGRASRNNNLFGWANGRRRFATKRQSIHHVAQRLRLAPHYAGKTLSQKLKTYNRRSLYRKRVLKMMQEMPPDSMAEAEGVP